jgi:hypothetical protein
MINQTNLWPAVRGVPDARDLPGVMDVPGVKLALL